MPDEESERESIADDGESGSPVVGPDTVVAFHYHLYDGERRELERSEGGPPVRFLYGERGVLAALQEAFRGRRAGESFSATLPAARAYGRRYPERLRRVPRKSLAVGRGGALRPGQPVSFRGPDGRAVSATVVKAGRFNVDLDTNHPLAGLDLTFEVRIVEVREASASERAHGHAHGPGGHEHH